jgi:hypothetical protein
MTECEIVIDLSEDQDYSSSLEAKRQKSAIKIKNKSKKVVKKTSKMIKITANERARRYSKDGLYAIDGKLKCRHCYDKEIDLKLSTIENHIRGNKHLSHRKSADSSSMQRSVDSMTKDFSSKHKRIQDMNKASVKAFAEANNPIFKFDHPSIKSFFSKYVVNGDSLYSSTALRDMIKDIANEEKSEVLKKVHEMSSYSIIADETCDANGKAMMNLILIPSNYPHGEESLNSVLLDTIELKECNSQSVAKEIINSLNQKSILLEKMFGFVSDNCSYMIGAFKIISIICTNAIHMTCWSHIFDLIAQTFYKSFPKTDKFVANMKKSFNHKRKMCRYYKNSINKMPPKPIKTRWTSWLKAVKEHSINFEKYETLFEMIKKDKIGKSKAFKSLYSVFKNKTYESELKSELDFISKIADTIIERITCSEEMKVSVHQIYNDANVLNNMFNGMILCMENSIEINITEKFVSNSINALKTAKLKLEKYLFSNKQPSHEFIDQIRIFDPKQILNCSDFQSIQLKSLHSIPYIMNLLKENKIDKCAKLYSEFNKYKSLANNEENQQLNIMQFWSKNKEQMPLLSNVVMNYMSIPISGAEVERSFSCLGNILTDKRRRLTTENLKDLLFLNYNSKHKFET